jgi:protein-tyrosine phosphatase
MECRNILVLCLGNICRSPSAECFLRQALPPGFQVKSAGLSALEGKPADPNTRFVMQRFGLDISQHRGRMLTRELAHWAQLILVMNKNEKEALCTKYPETRGKTFLLGNNISIEDPYGRGRGKFIEVISDIKAGADFWAEKIKELSLET